MVLIGLAILDLQTLDGKKRQSVTAVVPPVKSGLNASSSSNSVIFAKLMAINSQFVESSLASNKMVHQVHQISPDQKQEAINFSFKVLQQKSAWRSSLTQPPECGLLIQELLITPLMMQQILNIH